MMKKNDAIKKSYLKPEQLPKSQSKVSVLQQKPPFSRTSMKPRNQMHISPNNTHVFNNRTKNSVFKGSKGSLTGKDLSLVGKKVKRMEQ